MSETSEAKMWTHLWSISHLGGLKVSKNGMNKVYFSLQNSPCRFLHILDERRENHVQKTKKLSAMYEQRKIGTGNEGTTFNTPSWTVCDSTKLYNTQHIATLFYSLLQTGIPGMKN